MIIKKNILVLALVISFSQFSFAAILEKETIDDKISVFRQVADITTQQIKVPTVVEIPLEFLPFSRKEIAVFDRDENIFVPNVIVNKGEYETISVNITTNKSKGADSSLVDNDFETFVDFDLPEDKLGEAVFLIEADEPFTSDAFWMELAPHVAMPEKVEVRAEIDGVSKIMLAETGRRVICLRCLSFPKTTSSKWQIKIKYGHSLRI